MNSHLQAVQAIASGIHAVPSTSSAFAATQAAYRFLNNERVTLRSLAEPLIEAGRQEAIKACDRYALVAHDWSQLMYKEHVAKRDRIMLSSKHVPEGYKLQTALLLSDRDGSPLAPLAMSLRAADGVHCSRAWKVRPAASPLDELDPTMTFIEQQNLGRPLVHVIDAEADSVFHFRNGAKNTRGISWFAPTIASLNMRARSSGTRRFAKHCAGRRHFDPCGKFCIKAAKRRNGLRRFPSGSHGRHSAIGPASATVGGFPVPL